MGDRARDPLRRRHRAAVAADRAVSDDRAAVADDQRRPIPAPTRRRWRRTSPRSIEQELNGVEGFLYMSSTSQSNGTASITVTFRSGTDINVALMDVQNRLRRVEARLPEEVRRQGVQVGQGERRLPDDRRAHLEVAARCETLELGNFAVARVVDELRRVPGVGDVRSFSLRVRDAHLARSGQARELQPVRRRRARRGAGAEQPVAPAARSATGRSPRGASSTRRSSRRAASRTPEQFANIILRANPDGSVVRLGDVARVELGAQTLRLRHRAERRARRRHGDPAHAGRQRARRRRRR